MNWMDILRAAEPWQAPALPADGAIPHGDMPGDKVEIGEAHIRKANAIFPALREELLKLGQEKVVIAVSGGSGVGKSETASLLSYYLNALGIGAYTLSGDNYPRRIPAQNDAERERIYRNAGLHGLLAHGQYTAARGAELRAMWESGADADPKTLEACPWMARYQEHARAALKNYLGTEAEQDFAHLNDILSQFKDGAKRIWLRRMGRTPDALWYDEVDFSNIPVLVVEWTHGNSAHLEGVDVPILLNSTPEETAAHRRARARDGKTDSPFTTVVLQVEQGMLHARADAAKIIVSKSGELLSHADYHRLMED